MTLGTGRDAGTAPTPIGLDGFVATLASSRLVSKPEIDRLRAGLAPGDVAASDASVRFAKRLIESNHITRYQARKLLAGVTKGFFVGGNRILKRLGEGGMGKVYLAVDERTGEKVAIKVLPPKKAQESEQLLKRFRREMDLSRMVKHPNVARTHDVGQDNGVYYMVMEYIPGDSLYHLVKARGGPLRVPDTARYFLKVLEGLSAAHAAGLVHRDIKPSNLMITPNGDAKILDLGLARAMGEDSPLTRPNTVLGTLDYASPEQLSDAAKADVRSDLYSIGCTIYFTLSGRAPFEGGDVVNKIYKQRMEDPRPLEEVARGVPLAFAAIVRKLMAKEPDERYQTCGELSSDLARWVDPDRVKAILGTEAEVARAFKPPPPELDDEDLRLLPDPGPSVMGSSSLTLRDLGEAEPTNAPMYRPPPPPRAAIVVPRRSPSRSRGDESEDLTWLWRLIAVACAVGLIAVAIFSLLGG